MPLHAAQLRVLALLPHWAHEADRHAESAHCIQRYSGGPIETGGGRACRRAHIVEPVHLVWCQRRNGKRYQLHQPASTVTCSPDLS